MGRRRTHYIGISIEVDIIILYNYHGLYKLRLL